MLPVGPHIPATAALTNTKSTQNVLFSGFFERNLKVDPSKSFWTYQISKKEADERSALVLSTLSELRSPVWFLWDKVLNTVGNAIGHPPKSILTLEPVSGKDTWYRGQFSASPWYEGDIKVYKGTIDGLTVEVVDREHRDNRYVARNIAIYKEGEGGKRGTIFLNLENHRDSDQGDFRSYGPGIHVLLVDNKANNAGLAYHVQDHDGVVESSYKAYKRLLPLLKKIDTLVPDPEWVKTNPS